MKMVNGLTKVNASKYGIEVAPQHDFNDDGNRFRGFEYKGIPMTQCRADGECYLCIRVDYLKNNFTYKEWMETEEYHLCDEFNGVSQFDIEKLIENLERVIDKVDEMNSNASVDKNELENVKNVICDELNKRESFMEEIKTFLELWNVKSGKKYYVKHIIEYANSLKNEIERGYKILKELDTMEVRQQKEFIERSKSSYGILGSDFYMKTIREWIEKATV